MGIVTEACKQQIRARVPLEDLVREYSVQLVPSGKRWKGLCPFHAEKTPSFSIDVEKQFYFCFGCQAAGDVFKFVMAIQHVDFPQALEILARRAGVDLAFEGGGRGLRSSEPRVLEVYDALDLASRFYREILLHDPQARVARDYVRKRGIEPAIAERFQIGYSPPEWDAFLRHATARGFAPETLDRAGLVRKREQGSGYYDYFRGRVMFPIADPQNRVIGFGARTLGDEQPKYLNTSKTSVFDKSQVLYGLPQARAAMHREGLVGVVEGYTDAILAHQGGLDFVVASLGTAFTLENARRLGRLAPRALLIFDGDDAGQRATERSLDLLVAENLDVRVYTVKDGKDPCDAILALGGAEFRRRVEAEAVGIFEFKWRRTMESAGVKEGGPVVRARALDELLTLLAKVPNVVARKLQARELAEKVGVSEEDIEGRLRIVGRRAEPRFSRDAPSPAAAGGAHGAVAPGTVTHGAVEGPLTELERLVLECMLALPSKAAVLWGKVPQDLFRSDPAKRLAGNIERCLEDGTLSAARIAEMAEDPETQGLVARLLGELEDDDGHSTRDYDAVLKGVERDLERHTKRARLDGLKRLLAGEPRSGSEELSAVRREYMETLKELKRG
jgi:DNA primase